MTRAAFLTALAAAALCAASAASAGADGTHLELSAGLSPTFVQDPAYEALSEDDLRAERLGADLRVEVARFGYFRLVPFLSYRGAGDRGSPYQILDTRLLAHDFAAGLRLRTWFRSWIGMFLEVEGGVTYLKLEGNLDEDDEFDDGSGPRARDEYSDEAATWLVGGLLGLELRLPPSIFRRRGIDWLDFGIEIGGGYLRRGEAELAPALGGGDENSLALAAPAGWGKVDLSGWVVQVMFTVSLF
jgi:hypothetical protein